ncbi:MAG: divalent-cation tolerance protein CutA [Candidatus Aenigmatarchaeota archaeon]
MNCVIFTTCPNEKSAERIAINLLKKRLIACVSIISKIKSFYWWQKKIEKSSEVLMMMKTKGDLFSLVKKEILKIHPYSVPEIICLKIEKGNEKYLKWIEEVVKK